MKNKQSSIPFAKFKQPGYMRHNQYGTSAHMIAGSEAKTNFIKLKQIHEDRNAQNKKYKKLLLKSNYKIGYYDGQKALKAVPTSRMNLEFEREKYSNTQAGSSKAISVFASSDRSVKISADPMMMSQSMSDFGLSQAQKLEIAD